MKSDRKFDTISQTLIIYKLPVTIGTNTGNNKHSDYVALIKQGASAPNLQYKRRDWIASRVLLCWSATRASRAYYISTGVLI